jgi:hypothetical protein
MDIIVATTFEQMAYGSLELWTWFCRFFLKMLMFLLEYYGPYMCWPIRVLYFVSVTVARVFHSLYCNMVPEP